MKRAVTPTPRPSEAPHETERSHHSEPHQYPPPEPAGVLATAGPQRATQTPKHTQMENHSFSNKDEELWHNCVTSLNKEINDKAALCHHELFFFCTKGSVLSSARSTAFKSYFAKPSIRQLHRTATALTPVRAEVGPGELFCGIGAVALEAPGSRGARAVAVPGQNRLLRFSWCASEPLQGRPSARVRARQLRQRLLKFE